MPSHRVVVTGLGTICPVGLDVPTTWRNLLAGQSGVGPITHFDTTGYRVRFAAEVHGFEPTDYMEAKTARRSDRFVQFAIAAAREALAQSRLTITPHNAEEVGIIIGSGIGGVGTYSGQAEVLMTKGPRHINPFLIPMIIIDMAAGQLAIEIGAQGPNFGVVSACATGAHAIGEAFETIRRGDAQAMIAGGSDAAIVPISVAAFDRMRALSRRNDAPEQASRPFDANRDGFVLGEGGAIVVLERLDSARARGAEPLAEMVGYAATADAAHITIPAEQGRGAALAMARALHKAGLRPDDVDYINAHGTSTPLNDRLETAAIKQVFGQHAHRLAISSTKSMTGHLLGAAGALEAIACIMAIGEGRIPPTINYQTPDPDCDLDYVPNVARTMPVRVAMSNAFGFGGHNVTLIFKAYP